MTRYVFALPRVAGDSEDADLAVSFISSRIPLDWNLKRWCGQFEWPEGKSCEEVLKQEEVDGAKFPASVVTISGTYRGSAMAGVSTTPRPDYCVMVAELRTPSGSWYVKAKGPQRTVDHWRQSVIDAVREAR